VPKKAVIPAALLLIVALFLAEILASTAFGMTHDDGVYLVTAKALAEGKGYRIISLPGAPPQTKYPILFPFLLSIVWRIDPHFPQNGFLLKAVPAFAMAGWMMACYWFLRRYAWLPRHAALWILYFVAVNQWSLFTSGTLMSEALFSLLALGAIALLAHTAQRPPTGAVIAAALVASAAYHTRTAALPLIPAGGIALAAQKRYRHAALFCGIAMLLALPWLWWQRQATDAGTFAENYYTANGYRNLNVLGGRYSVEAAAHIVNKNLHFLAEYPAAWLFCVSFPPAWHRGYAVAGILFWLLALRGMLRAPPWLRAAQIFTVVTAGMLLLYAWPPERFVVPVLPLLLLFAYFAMPRRTPVWVAPALAILPLVLAYNEASSTRANHVASLKAPPWIPSNQAPEWNDVAQVTDWIRDHVAPGAVVLADFDPTLYLYSGHPAIRISPLSGPEMFYGSDPSPRQKLAEAERIIAKDTPAYLIDTCCDPVPPDYLVDYLKSAGRLRLVYQGAPGYKIFAILAAGENHNFLSDVPISRK